MNALDYTCDLVGFGSISSRTNADVSDYVEAVLKQLEFDTERIEYTDAAGIRKVNVVGKKGVGTGGLAYFGHTDVVPADPWFTTEHGPFAPTVKAGRLYGRGACDMKGSIGCILAAAERFPRKSLRSPLYVTCTADEEVGYTGAAEVARRSQLYREMVTGATCGIVGEPTELKVVYAHKGTYGFRAVSHGRAAHSSTRHGMNANLAMIPFLVEMKAIHDETESDPGWQDDRFEPPTVSWNIGINDHTAAVNITAPQSICTVYFRPMPGQKPEILLDRARAAADRRGLEFQVLGAAPPLYVDPKSELVSELLAIVGQAAPQTVTYGTDGTQFTALEKLAVFGPGSIAQAHTFDEWVALEQLDRGTQLYERAIERWCR
ncbi:MAG TPA: M20/M25/M40 family metallo-hydrolase [Planctomycetaceae bacterium]|jgi:acetylornithine deacetylase|nr:M20/M25/M40 family metallo-hydrolase [Planctomycetaceae bacterium]